MTRLDLLETEYWTWRLFANQSCLGRTVFDLNRGGDGSLATVSDDEWAALRATLKAYEAVMRRLFQPDRFNYMQLGNVVASSHVHAVPRYRTGRTWGGVVFVDRNWGGAPHPEPQSPLDGEETAALADWLRAELIRNAEIYELGARISG